MWSYGQGGGEAGGVTWFWGPSGAGLEAVFWGPDEIKSVGIAGR